jgi:glycosyltransferase involved in cell wall biosynthesis
MRVALVTDTMSFYGGAERVIEQILQVYPAADIFSLVDVTPTGQRDFLGGRNVKTTFLQRLPYVEKVYRGLFPLWPFAVEQIDVRGYDLVISSHHSVAHGVVTSPAQTHVAYVHSPMRYAWDLQHEYLQEAGLKRSLKSLMARSVLHYARMWDSGAAHRPDALAANSRFVQRRIRKFYGRDSEVIHPPVAVESFAEPAKDPRTEYVSVCRLVPYKRVNLLVEAFARMPNRRLTVIGTGPDLMKIAGMAPPNVAVLGWVDGTFLRHYMSTAKAVLFAGIEDFGISLVEAQAAGTPVIALARGGALETVRGLHRAIAPTGVLFDEQTPEAIIAAIEDFERSESLITEVNCRENASRFSEARFRDHFRAFVESALENGSEASHPAAPRAAQASPDVSVEVSGGAGAAAGRRIRPAPAAV